MVIGIARETMRTCTIILTERRRNYSLELSWSDARPGANKMAGTLRSCVCVPGS